MLICLLAPPPPPGRPRKKLTSFFRRVLLQPAQGLPDEQKAHKHNMKFPGFLLDLEKWPVFLQYNIIFHFHEASLWNCQFFHRLVLKLGNELFYFFRIRTIYTQTRGINTKWQQNQCGEVAEPGWTYSCFSAIWTNAWYMGHNWTLSNLFR